MRIGAISWGIFFIGIGVFVFCINFGYLDNYVWVKLLSLWPVAIIAIGIALIFNHSKLKFLALLAPLLIALAFIYVALSEWGNDGYRPYHRGWSNTDYGREVFKYSLANDPQVKQLYVSMDIGNGELWIGSSSQELFNGDFEYRRRRPHCDFEVVGDEGRLIVKSRDDRWYGFFAGRNYKNDARIYIGNYLPLDLKLDLGASDIELDLTDHMLRKLKLEAGASRVDLHLGCRSNEISVDIESGASDLTVSVPRNMALEIDSDAALSSTNFKDIGLEKVDGIYRSSNFDSAACTAHFNIDSGVSKVRIEYY